MLQRRTTLKRTAFKPSSPMKRAPMKQGSTAMKQGSTLARSSSFKPKVPARPAREERVLRPVAPLPAGARRGVPARISDKAVAIPKQPHEGCQRLLDMARDKSCLFWFVAECRGEETSTTVHAHDNRLSANKGRGYKAHDWRGLRACYDCHAAYDQGKKHTREQKNAAFDEAYERQLAVWREMAASRSIDPKDRAAAQWAIERYEHYRRAKDAGLALVPASGGQATGAGRPQGG